MNSVQKNKDVNGRRPLKVRNFGFSKTIATWLARKNITPNQISILSVAFAALAAISLLLIQKDIAVSYLLPLLAGVFIQCRLLCNLFDGMVAVEGGKSTPAGELFNDIPDRIADPLILVACGYAVTVVSWGETAGWCAGLLAVMTAYIRTLAASIGAPVDFRGPMAKQHRMAIVTIACVITSFETYLWPQGYSLLIALLIIIIGCVVTIARRSWAAYYFLENKPTSGNS